MQVGLGAMLAAVLLVGCTSPAGRQVSADRYREDLSRLSADDMQGRGPGTPGGEKAAAYIADRFKEAGLEPADDGSYFQNVPLVGLTADPSAALHVRAGNQESELAYSADFVAWAGVENESVAWDDDEVVFVGYGVTAPEADWNDYKDSDVAGKVLLMLVNDPPSDDPSFFGGKALTYYGRWTYKLEEAARRGAKGVLLIHETDMAGYPWGVVTGSWTGEQFSLPAEGEKSTIIEGWVQKDQGDSLLRTAGLSFDEAREKAAQRDFRPVPLPARVSLRIDSTMRRIESPNVVGILRGSDPAVNDQVVVLTSHYDHLGIGPEVDGDTIYNGAFDNASGTAALIEMARAMAAAPAKPRRSILFAAVTAEEQGLLGSEYYAHHPLVPLAKTAANVNIDGVNVWGRTRNIVPMGAERSSIEEVVGRVASEMKMELSPDPSPEKGYYFRSDHFSLVKVGVPAVYIDMGLDFADQPAGWGEQMMDEYTAKHYHQPSDEYDPSWTLEGAVQEMEFVMRTVDGLADQPEMPSWKAGDPFEEIRGKTLQ